MIQMTVLDQSAGHSHTAAFTKNTVIIIYPAFHQLGFNATTVQSKTFHGLNLDFSKGKSLGIILVKG